MDCVIRAGTYHETVTPNSGITIGPYAGEPVTVDGSDAVTGWTLYQGSIYKAKVTLNSDDTPMFGTTLAREYQLAQDAFGFTDEHLREIARNSLEASFLPAEQKVRFLDLVDGTPIVHPARPA